MTPSTCFAMMTQERGGTLAANRDVLQQLLARREEAEGAALERFLQSTQENQRALERLRHSNNEEYKALRTRRAPQQAPPC